MTIIVPGQDGTRLRAAKLAAFWRERDPGLLALRRSARAALIMPVTFAIASAASANIQVALFASFGSFALLQFVDLGGSGASRLRGYAALVAVAVPLIVVGTICSARPVLAVAAMAVVGFGVLFAGVFSPQAALGSMYLLLAFVLPVCVPVPAGQVLPRLAGWALAAGFALPARPPVSHPSRRCSARCERSTRPATTR
jgi:hypothetical protein